jgi:uncharacterized protein (DUF697 family)
MVNTRLHHCLIHVTIFTIFFLNQLNIKPHRPSIGGVVSALAGVLSTKHSLLPQLNRALTERYRPLIGGVLSALAGVLSTSSVLRIACFPRS